jgi:CDP-paratose 2-epimerase
MAFLAFYEKPRAAAVYNLGGGRANSVSVLEAIHVLERLLGSKLKTEYVDTPRLGDHICYISDLRAFQRDYKWTVEKNLDAIFEELAGNDSLEF